MKVIVALVAFLATLKYGLSADNLNIRAWKSASSYPEGTDFPESDLLKGKPNTAIGFTGGGSRAYTAAIGQLAALTELGLIKNIRYIGGISGGAWATVTYSFAQNVSSDETFLGSVTLPRRITRSGLQEMSSECARGFVSKDLSLIAVEALLKRQVDSVAASWAYAIQKVYLDPVQIPADTHFSWSEDTVKDIKKRNLAALKDTTFVLPTNSDRPFPILGSALVGPAAGAPYGSSTQNYTMLEITPLYVGQFRTLDVSYKYNKGFTHKRTVGGAIEPFGFSRSSDDAAPKTGISSKDTTSTLLVPTPTSVFDLQYAAAASSYAPGALFESLPLNLTGKLALSFDYWSPVDTLPSAEPFYFADGGSYENIPLISYLQRRVDKIILFLNAEATLQTSSNWDVTTDEFENQITDSLSSFFGVLPESQPGWQNRSYEYERNKVFSNDDFVTVIQLLQAAQAEGNGILATVNLTTIENSWWGIPAGIQSQITFVYLGRLSKWESQLSKEMTDLLVPETNSEDLSVDISHGPFRHFPHYPTLGGDISYEKANALADLTGWVILQNADLFKSILS